MAVPLHWDGALRGVLNVGFRSARFITGQDLALLETFGELAAVACRNASAATGLALAAHTDGLTGCLNHAALHDGLRREIERCARTGQELSLVLVRPRRLQAGQRGPRPPGRRRGAAPRRPRAADGDPPL